MSIDDTIAAIAFNVKEIISPFERGFLCKAVNTNELMERGIENSKKYIKIISITMSKMNNIPNVNKEKSRSVSANCVSSLNVPNIIMSNTIIKKTTRFSFPIVSGKSSKK
jgi:hypothetical protein